MKVLLVNASLEAVRGGGTAERTYALARHLAAIGDQVSVLTTDIGQGHHRLADRADIELVVLRCLSDRLYFPAPAFGRVYRAVAQADIVHIMNHWTVINAYAYWAARIARRPYVFCPAGALPVFGRSRFIKACYNQVVGHAIASHASRGIAIADNEVAQFADYGVAADRVVRIPNGIDLYDYRQDPTDTCPIPELCASSDASFLLFIGRLNRIKGPDLLLDAFLALSHEFPRSHLVFAGPDEGLREPLARQAAQHAAGGRIHFAGSVTGGPKRWLLRNAALVAIPSRQEAMSIVALEAGASSRPVLLTDQCGFPQVAEAGGGLMVAPTSDAIESGLRALLVEEADLDAMGERLFRLVSERYTWRAAAQSLHDCLAEVVRESART